MTRPRAMNSKHCIQCRRIPHTPEEVDNVAAHRMQHRRQDKRRAQWREYKARLRARDGRVGALHSLSCDMPRRCNCRAIPVYSKTEEAA